MRVHGYSVKAHKAEVEDIVNNPTNHGYEQWEPELMGYIPTQLPFPVVYFRHRNSRAGDQAIMVPAGSEDPPAIRVKWTSVSVPKGKKKDWEAALKTAKAPERTRRTVDVATMDQEELDKFLEQIKARAAELQPTPA